MATIQAKISRGQKYWYIVESRRINGKPRPVVLAYLGKAETLLQRLQSGSKNLSIKSYSHGLVSALLKEAETLDIVEIINKHVKSRQEKLSEKPIRNHLTAGATLLLAAIGRVCHPTSKDGWITWANSSSLSYLLRKNFSKLDSRHFWDHMDCIPEDSIQKIESEILQSVWEHYEISTDTLFFDTTNFFTFISSKNTRCCIAQRGKNKQKRVDLKQIGLALVVTREDRIPLFHLTYKGNLPDCKVFTKVYKEIKNKMKALGLHANRHTFVFDKGMNSKSNFALIDKEKLYFVGSLSPFQQKKIVNKAVNNFKTINFNEKSIQVFKEKRLLWGKQRTIITYISENLKSNQIFSMLKEIEKIQNKLQDLDNKFLEAKKKSKKAVKEKQVKNVIGKKYEKVFQWELSEMETGKFTLSFSINQKAIKEIEDKFGFKILVTNRHSWDVKEIIQTYNEQATIENEFKNIKDPMHLAFRPQFHWTDQKIRVHFLLCFIGHLLSSLIYKKAKDQFKFKGKMRRLLDILNEIRLAVMIQTFETKKGKPNIEYVLETMTSDQEKLLEILTIQEAHKSRPKIKGVGVYT